MKYRKQLLKSWEQREHCSSVGGESGEDIGPIAMDASHNTDVLCAFRKGNKISKNINWRYYLGILDTKLIAGRTESKKFGLFK